MGRNNVAVIQYQGDLAQGDSGLQLTQIYTLVGSQPGSGSSAVSEQIQLINGGSSPVDLYLFQYNNLQISNGADVLQFPSPAQISQTSGSGTAEIVATGLPTAYEAGTAPALLNALASASPAVLTNASGPVAGDPASAMEWEAQLGVGKSYTLSEDYSLNIVPEPSTVSLLAALAVLSALARFCRNGIRGTAR